MTRGQKDALALAMLWSMADVRGNVGWLGHVYNNVCGLGYHTMAEVDGLIKAHGLIAR
jgi:hypothetical protein